jgi:hypothetical protein
MALLRKDELIKITQDDRMLATPLLVLCVDTFGTEFFDWEPETFNIECAGAFGKELPDVNRDKVWALVTVLTTDLFYKSLEAFIPIANTLNDSTADFDTYDPVTSEEAAWAITEATLMDPPIEDEPGPRFSHDIRRYIGETLRAEGVTNPPNVLAPYAEYDPGRAPSEMVGISVGPDPDFVAMYEKRQTAERTAIEDYVKERLVLLHQQLQLLPLEHGTVSVDAGKSASVLTG